MRTSIQAQDTALAFDNRFLELIILPTEQCNFRCTYCYEDFKDGKISSDVVQGIKSLLKERAHELDLLKISWFGGEPLLAKRQVLDISSFAKELSEKHGFKFFSEMTTNGYFLDESTAGELDKVNLIKYQISLDGYGESHNKTRKKANGTGSFDQIWNNLVKIKNSNVSSEIMLRVHYSPSNLKDIDFLISQLRDTLLTDSRFNILFRSIGKMGGENDNQIEEVNRIQQTLANSFLSKKVGNQNSVNQHNELENVPMCYASRMNSFVIRANGDVNKCTVSLDQEYNRVGRITSNGSLNLDEAKMLRWAKGVIDENIDVQQCPNKYFLADTIPVVTIEP
ncbi:radical SAM protein [Vibrio hepatarius]|uniref:radical SAM protein n=1 Tax=Vibrio hepatarius TaxID=171383 RepID=UPI00148BA557|nr:radical SAM protein [Vibrio hepatarius]NOI13923.1 radical SAM protein [Vibrio hepatarius]